MGSARIWITPWRRAAWSEICVLNLRKLLSHCNVGIYLLLQLLNILTNIYLHLFLIFTSLVQLINNLFLCLVWDQELTKVPLSQNGQLILGASLSFIYLSKMLPLSYIWLYHILLEISSHFWSLKTEVSINLILSFLVHIKMFINFLSLPIKLCSFTSNETIWCHFRDSSELQ